MSPTSGSAAPRRRLSARRGSHSAPDPYGLNVEVDNARGTASRITIVSVAPPIEQQQPRQGGARDRTSWGSSHSTSSNASTGRGRMSFALSSFTPINGSKNGSGGEGSPTRAQGPPTSPGRPNLKLGRSNSGGSMERAGYSVGRGQKLTAEQICDLAVNSMAGPVSPGLEKTPVHTPFLLLSEEQYLPFLERPSEVTALLTSPPTSRLMALLSQTFPADKRAPYDALKADSVTPFGPDPTKWNFAELSRWLQTVDRHEANDREWVMKARRCVLARSELIWSRLKAALGVPPELEEQEEEEDGGDEQVAEYEYTDDREVFLEPIYPGEHMSCVASPINSPSGFNGQNGGMESIGEGAEDEEDGEKDKDQDAGASAAKAIQGLRISAPMVERDRPASPTVPIRRSHSTNAAMDDTESRRRQSLALAGPGRVRRSTQQEQGTGAPLFPSSFATLTMGPSLVANNPALRSGPRSSFRPGVPIIGRRGRFVTASGSLTGGWDTDGNDYAVSLGSGSERSFR